MKKYFPLLVLFVVLLGIWLLLNSFQLESFGKIDDGSENNGDVFSKMSQEAKKRVNYYLDTIDCEPNDYYLRNCTGNCNGNTEREYICFSCYRGTPCFGLGNKSEEEISLFDIKFYDSKNVETDYNFITLGFSEILGCDCDVNCTCDDGIELILTEYDTLMFYFPFDITKNYLDSIVSEHDSFGECVLESEENSTREDGAEFNFKRYSCDDLSILIINNRKMVVSL